MALPAFLLDLSRERAANGHKNAGVRIHARGAFSWDQAGAHSIAMRRQIAVGQYNVQSMNQSIQIDKSN